MQIKFKKLAPGAVAPKQGTLGSAGFDLVAIRREVDMEHDLVLYHTGIAVEIPRGYVGLLFPRSSIHRLHVSLTNSVGVIDSDYRGEVKAVFRAKVLPRVASSEGYHYSMYEVGERFAQLVIVPIPDVEYVEAEELSETCRGEGGYGSTGR